MPTKEATRLASTHTRGIIEAFLQYLEEERRYPASTVSTYSRSYERLAVFLDAEELHLLQVEDDELRRFVNRTSKGHADNTRRKLIMELRSLYEWMQNVVRIQPVNYAKAIKPPKVAGSDPHPTPDDVWKRLWWSRLSDVDRVAFGLGFFCGLRREEVTRLDPAQFGVRKGHVTTMWRKGGDFVTFPWEATYKFIAERRPDLALVRGEDVFLPALKRLLHDREGMHTLCGEWMRVRDPKWLNPTNFNKRMTAAETRLRFPAGTLKPHDLRHAFCTNLVALGVDLVDVAALAHHKDPKTTLIYVKLAQDPLAKYALREAVAAAPAPVAVALPTEAPKSVVRKRY